MEWTRGPTIGRGSSAVVSLATTATGHLLAVKSADISSSSLLQHEQYLISQLCSPFIVKCFGSDTTFEKDKSYYNIFLEYIPGATLSHLIRTQALDENAIQIYTHQMLKGLNYLHQKGFAHCDIKGQNILISNDGILKIVDFGCAKKIECSGGDTRSFSGTPAYMAPEVARGEEQSFPADIWALGCTIIEMATGSNPWPEMKDPASVLYRVAYSENGPEIPGCFSDTVKDFVEKCLIRDPKDRWTAAQLLQHPFFDDIGDCVEKSPTSVMGQAFWDAVAVEEEEDSSNEAEIAPSSSHSPASRISGLIVGDASNFPNWTDHGEDWATVRDINGFTIDIEQCSGYREEESSIVFENTVFNSFIDHEIGSTSRTFQVRYGDSDDIEQCSGIHEEESSIVVEDTVFNCFIDIHEISSNIKTFQVRYGDSDDIDDSASSGIVTLERMVFKIIFSDSDQRFLKSFIVLFSLFLDIMLHHPLILKKAWFIYKGFLSIKSMSKKHISSCQNQHAVP